MKKTLFGRMLKFGGGLNKMENIISLISMVILVSIWYIITSTGRISGRIPPNPLDVLHKFPALVRDHDLMYNIRYTVSLNLARYIIGLLVTIPLEFIISIFPRIYYRLG